MTQTSYYLQYPALISHLTGADNYTWLSFRNGKKVLLSKPICFFEKHFSGFIRVHKTAVVNPAYIQSLQCPPRRKMAGAVHMQCGTVLPVGRRRWAEVVELLQEPLPKETYLLHTTDSPTIDFILRRQFSDPKQHSTVKRPVFITIKDDMRALLFQKIVEERWPRFDPIFFGNGAALREALVAATDSQLPVAIILDLDKSKDDTQKMLKFVGLNDRLQQIPTLIFTPTKLEVDRSYNLGVNAVIKTPSELSEFTRVVERVCCYWFSLAALPEVVR